MNLFYKSADIVKSSLQIYLDEGQQFSQAWLRHRFSQQLNTAFFFIFHCEISRALCIWWSTYTTFIISPLTQVGKLFVELSFSASDVFRLSTIVCLAYNLKQGIPWREQMWSRRCRVAMDLQLQSGVLANASSYRDLVVRLCTLNLHAGVSMSLCRTCVRCSP